MESALRDFLEKLARKGEVVEVEVDKDGVEFIALSTRATRLHFARILNLIHYKCIGYVVVKRHKQEYVRLCRMK